MASSMKNVKNEEVGTTVYPAKVAWLKKSGNYFIKITSLHINHKKHCGNQEVGHF